MQKCFVSLVDVIGCQAGENQRRRTGKTTAMRMITGFLPDTEGTVTGSGFDIFEKPKEVKTRIGYLSEHPPVCEDMTAKGYLKFVAKIKPRTTNTATSVIDILLPPVLESGYDRFSPVFDTVLLLGS